MSATPPEPTREAPITSIQPGGGTCFAAEAAWGRFRRAVLRRFFPGHVARMAALRAGTCDRGHDVIDSRDLKLVRNVCGYDFPPETDPFAWRGRLGFARAGFAEMLIFSALFAVLVAVHAVLAALVHPAWASGIVVILPFWVFTFAFFRDPNRPIPADADALVCPADGVITNLEEIDAPDFPGGRAFRVSIFLSVFDVHVNRCPRAATVTKVRYFPGEFLDARSQQCHIRNEQLWVDVVDERLGFPMRVKQVSGAIARRIVCELRQGERVDAGARFGMIKFGSRTDVLLPVANVAEVRVKVGDAVRGGADVLLRVKAT